MVMDYREKLERAKTNLKAEKQKKYKIHKFCKNFRLEDEIKEKSFNNKFSHPDYIHVFSKNNDYSESFPNSVRTRIGNGGNMVLGISGEPNSGKSEGGATIGFEIQAALKEILSFNPPFYYSFTTSEFNENIVKIKKDLAKIKSGGILLRDEDPREHGRGARTLSENLENIKEIVRKVQVFFIFIAPRKPKELSKTLFTYFLESAGKDYENNKIRFLLYDPTHKDGKIPIGRIKIERHNNDKFREEYQKRKDEFIERGLSTGGQYAPEIDIIRFQKDVKNIYKFCLRKRIDQKNLIETQIRYFNKQLKLKKNRDKEDKVQWDLDSLEKLINEVWFKLRKKYKRIDKRKQRLKELKKVHEAKLEGLQRANASLKIEQQLSANLTKFKFEYNENDIFAIIQKEKESVWKDSERDIEIYVRAKKDRTIYREIVKSYREINDETSITKIVNKVQGEINRIAGSLLENAFSDYLIKLKLFDKVEKNGAHGQSDVIAYKGKTLFIFSLKNIKIDKKHYYEIPVHEYYPELRLAREQKERHKKEAYCYLGIFDNSTNNFSIKSINLSFPAKPIEI